MVLLHEHYPYDICSSRRAHKEALAACRAGKEIVSEYSSDFNVVPGYNSDSSYEFDFGSDPIESEFELNTTEEPLSGHATGLVITSTLAGRFVYWHVQAHRPDQRQLALRCLPQDTPLPGVDITSSK
jgi:hypothetical protein